MSVTLAVTALEAAPAVISGIQEVASAVETDIAGHKTIAETTTGALAALKTSLGSPAVTSAVGATVATEAGNAVSLAEESVGLGTEIGAMITKIEAFFAKL